MIMAYCSNCGEKLPRDAYFCPNCGTKTMKGTETKVASSADDMREAFNKMEVELQKAFAVAAKEIQAAFQTARDNVQQSIRTETVVCSNCGEKNPHGSVFCYKCGEKIVPKDEKKE
jgi:uncharacterized membrane protein YvbJ